MTIQFAFEKGYLLNVIHSVAGFKHAGSSLKDDTRGGHTQIENNNAIYYRMIIKYKTKKCSVGQ